MPRKRLLWQLFSSYIVVTILALFAVTWYATRSLRDFYHEETAADLHARAHLVAHEALRGVVAGDAAKVNAWCRAISQESGTRTTVIAPSGTVLGDSDENPGKMENHATSNRPEVLAALAGKRGLATRYSQTLGKDMMYLALPLRSDDGLVGLVRVSIPVTSIEDALARVYSSLTAAGVVIAAFAAIVGLLMSRRISQPLEEMKRGADRFAEGDLHVRLPVPETQELATLAEAMNEMGAQLDERLRTILEERNEHQAILASMTEGVIAVDTQECLLRMNKGATQMLGVKPGALAGQSIQEAVRNAALQKFVSTVLEGSEPVEEEIAVAHDDGDRILQAHGTALRDARGNRIGAVVVLNDVTRLRRLEGVRRDFVANVSHELRTPITSIKGFVETLLDGALADANDAPRFLGIVASQVDRLNAIIEDLLLLSRLEADGAKPTIALTNARVLSVLEGALGVCAHKADDRNITVELRCAPGLKAPVNAPLLEQALINLIDNAVNYSEPSSTVEVEASVHDGQTTLAVRDHGCGIEADDLPRLFERFYRVDKARSRKLGGTGLGLAIVKHIASVHGGRVTVESTPGQGSTFTIHLPRV